MIANGAEGDRVAGDGGRVRGRATPRTGMPPAARPPLLFVHGFLGEAADWDGLCALLGEDFSCDCLELPGHGAAPPVAAGAGRGPARWFPASAERLRAACAAQAAPPVLIGYSMGGRLALYTALRFPHTAGGLVVIGADPGIEEDAARAERLTRDEALARQLAAAGDENAFAGWLRRWYAAPLFGGLPRRADFDTLLRRRLRGRPASLAAALRGLSAAVQPVLWEALPRLPVPALFIVGAEDTKYRGVADRIATLGAPWQSAVCPHAAHAAHIEQPRAVAGLVRWFALSVAAGRRGPAGGRPWVT